MPAHVCSTRVPWGEWYVHILSCKGTLTMKIFKEGKEESSRRDVFGGPAKRIKFAQTKHFGGFFLLIPNI